MGGGENFPLKGWGENSPLKVILTSTSSKIFQFLLALDMDPRDETSISQY